MDRNPKIENSPPPTDPAEIHFKNAWQHRKFKRYPAAIAEFQKSLEHNPEKGATHFNLGWVYDQVGEGGLAITHVHKALQLFEGGNRASNVDSARGLLKKLQNKYPDSAQNTSEK